MNTKGHACYEIPIGSRIYPRALGADLRSAPQRLYVMGDPFALTGGVCLEGPADACLARDAGEAVARAGMTLVASRGRDWRLDAVEGALSMGGRVVVWSPLAPDVSTTRLPRLERALSRVLALGGAVASSHVWGRRDSRAADSAKAELYARACAGVTLRCADAAAGVAPAPKVCERQRAVMDCEALGKAVELAYLRHDAEGDPLLPIAEDLLAGNLCYRPDNGTCLYISSEWAPFGMTTLVCRDKVSVSGLSLCDCATDVTELGLDVGTVDLLLGDTRPATLAEAIAYLPRRVLCGAVTSMLNDPLAWLSARDPRTIARALGYEGRRPREASLGPNAPLAERVARVPAGWQERDRRAPEAARL